MPYPGRVGVTAGPPHWSRVVNGVVAPSEVATVRVPKQAALPTILSCHDLVHRDRERESERERAETQSTFLHPRNTWEQIQRHSCRASCDTALGSLALLSVADMTMPIFLRPRQKPQLHLTSGFGESLGSLAPYLIGIIIPGSLAPPNING